MITERQTEYGFNWTVIEIDRRMDPQELIEKFNFDEDIIEYALDKNERAHIEYNHKENSFLLIYNVVKLEKIDNHYDTVPVTFLIRNNKIFSIIDKESNYIISLMEEVLKFEEDLTIYSFLFYSLDLITEKYFPILNNIDIEKDILNKKLRKHTTKDNLLALSDIATGNVYLTSAANQNVALLNQIKTNPIYRKFNEDEKDALDVTLIESNQLLSMNMVISQVLDQLSATYNNILNNNLNEVVTEMNILSIILAILAVITGFFGMNVDLPLTTTKLAWIPITVVSIVLMFVIYYIMKKIFSDETK